MNCTIEEEHDSWKFKCASSLWFQRKQKLVQKSPIPVCSSGLASMWITTSTKGILETLSNNNQFQLIQLVNSLNFK